MQQRVTVEEARQLAADARKADKKIRRERARAEIEARRARWRRSRDPVTFRLPLPPLLNHYYRTTVVPAGARILPGAVSVAPLGGGSWRAITYISTEGKAYRKLVVEEWEKIGVTFEGRLAIKVKVVFRNHQEPDLDGFWKSLLDSLEHAGAFENDRQIKAESIEQEHVSAPGWIDVTLGPKPGERQGTLFATDW